MRVLCTATGSPSHGRALLPLARALAGAGHEVTVVTTADVAPVFAADPVTVEPTLPRIDFSAMGRASAEAAEAAEAAGADTADDDHEAHLKVLVDRLTGDMALEGHRVLAELALDLLPRRDHPRAAWTSAPACSPNSSASRSCPSPRAPSTSSTRRRCSRR
ncbi:hypothetical protein SRIMM317S_00243 [Streptomyces rimosus subsp. rimosus]